MLLENRGYFETFALHYIGGERYPHLERDCAKPHLLAAIFRARTGKAKP